MAVYVFVPLTDEILYEHPERIMGPIRPYSPNALRGDDGGAGHGRAADARSPLPAPAKNTLPMVTNQAPTTAGPR